MSNMQRTELLRCLDGNLKTPQKSERWAMYRLIMPVVDFANSTLKMPDYFEFNQTSRHGTSQSVDIVLLHDDKPRIMIEAKRVDRRISAEQIEKYLDPGIRGIVTNGVYWVLCVDGKNKSVTLLDKASTTVIAEALDEVVSFIRGEPFSHSGWSTEISYADRLIKPQRLAKETLARRVSNTVTVVRDTEDLNRELQHLSASSLLDKILLHSLVTQFECQGGLPSHLRCEMRASRISFFDERVQNGSTRVARVELGSKHPDVLVLTELLKGTTVLQALSSPAPHDKGPHMRRFRLSDESQTKAFGRVLADLLSAA